MAILTPKIKLQQTQAFAIGQPMLRRSDEWCGQVSPLKSIKKRTIYLAQGRAKRETQLDGTIILMARPH